jgi:hypothetical protein
MKPRLFIRYRRYDAPPAVAALHRALVGRTESVALTSAQLRGLISRRED